MIKAPFQKVLLRHLYSLHMCVFMWMYACVCALHTACMCWLVAYVCVCLNTCKHAASPSSVCKTDFLDWRRRSPEGTWGRSGPHFTQQIPRECSGFPARMKTFPGEFSMEIHQRAYSFLLRRTVCTAQQALSPKLVRNLTHTVYIGERFYTPYNLQFVLKLSLKPLPAEYTWWLGSSSWHTDMWSYSGLAVFTEKK